MTDQWKSSSVQKWWKHIWIHGFVIGVVCVLVGFLVWFFITETPWSENSHKAETAPPVQAPQVQAPPDGAAPAGPPVVPRPPDDPKAQLKIQLAQVLAGIKAANQKKDLSQLISHYSPNFPQLHQRTQDIAKTWKTYDYSQMNFAINEARLLPDQTAVARVTWEVEAHNISTGQQKHISKTYLISFAKESGQWRIRALDKAE